MFPPVSVDYVSEARMIPANDSPPARSRFQLIYWAVAVLIAAPLLYFSLRGIQWAQVRNVLSRAGLALVGLWIVLGTFSLFLRALRWRVLLRAQAPIGVATAFWATVAGYFGNNFLPARAGELVRSVMIRAHSGLSTTFVLTTALSERLCDAITLVMISSVILLVMPTRPGWFDRAARPFAILGLCGALGIIIAPRLEGVWRSVLGRVPLPKTIHDKFLGILEQILIGLRTFHETRRLLVFVVFTLVIWFSDAIGTVIGMHALGLTISLPVAFLLITGLGLGSALPSTPGYVGIYQFVAVSVLTPFGLSRADAIAYTLLAQALQYGGIGILGLLALTRTGAYGEGSRSLWSRLRHA
ncbi:MAG: flippase-like domain-containing protein [Acidobacteriaceae bacterium]|nr:flippase-like domain-containing protein [Acidobacteriaceae bacterium]MBV9295644.1 flippase-like domain-containing protein [Acidobacteriaceae bacterium]